MIKTAKRCALALVILALVFLAAYSVLEACTATANCGKSCSSPAGCGGEEMCIAFPDYATCSCGSAHKTVVCPPAR